MKGEFLTSAYTRLRSRLRHSGSDDDSDDALQEAFCRLWQRKESIREEQAEGLLAVTVRNVSIDNLRRKQTHPETPLEDTDESIDSGPDIEEIQTTYERIEALVNQTLSLRDKEILYRRDRDGWEFEEIAERYGISEPRLIVSRSRKTIRELYRKQNDNRI